MSCSPIAESLEIVTSTVVKPSMRLREWDSSVRQSSAVTTELASTRPYWAQDLFKLPGRIRVTPAPSSLRGELAHDVFNRYVASVCDCLDNDVTEIFFNADVSLQNIFHQFLVSRDVFRDKL